MTERQLYNRVRTVTAVCVLTLVALALFLVIQLITLSTLKAAEARYQQEIAATERQEEGLEAEIAELRSRTYVEQYAREHLGLTYSDEYRYTVQEEE